MKVKSKILIGLCTVSLASASAFSQEKAEDKKNWSLALNLGANLSGGNTESYLVNLGAEYNYTIKDSDIKAGVSLNYGEVQQTDEDGNTQMIKNVDKYDIYTSYRYNFSERYFADVIANMMHDYKADIKYRYKVGPNLGINILNNDTFVLSTSVGATYLYEEYENNLGRDEYLAWRLSEEFIWNIYEGTKLVQGAEYLPESEDLKNYLINFSLSLEAPVAKGMSMFVRFKDTYTSEPVDDKKKNDTSLIFGLQYSL